MINITPMSRDGSTVGAVRATAPTDSEKREALLFFYYYLFYFSLKAVGYKRKEDKMRERKEMNMNKFGCLLF